MNGKRNRRWREEALTDDRTARLVWAHIAEPRDTTVTSLIAEHGHRGAFAALLECPTARENVSGRLEALDLPEQQRRLERLGVRVLVPGDDEWPGALDDLEEPPHCLFTLGTGHLAELTRDSVALVGARAATHYGQRTAADIALGLGGFGTSIVSGGAFGIDAAAHRGALHGGASTVCVLAGGVDRAYPTAHENLFTVIRQEGVLVSEAPLGFAPMRHRFLHRNRLIAALSPGTVVVEAGLRSGSLSTARRAEELSRLVGAVPGPVTSATSAGCHDLIRDGVAVLVTRAEDVRELVGAYDARHGRLGGGGTRFDRPEDQVSALAKVVWDALPLHHPVGLEEVARAAGRSPRETLTALGELLGTGMAARDDGLWRKNRMR